MSGVKIKVVKFGLESYDRVGAAYCCVKALLWLVDGMETPRRGHLMDLVLELAETLQEEEGGRKDEVEPLTERDHRGGARSRRPSQRVCKDPPDQHGTRGGELLVSRRDRLRPEEFPASDRSGATGGEPRGREEP